MQLETVTPSTVKHRRKAARTVAKSRAIQLDMSSVNAALKEQIEQSGWAHIFNETPDELLAVDTNAKTIKGQALMVKTAILYLAPSDLSGTNVCAMALMAGCIGPCLFTAGRAGMFASILASRLRKTLFWLQHPERFLAQLDKEITRLKAKVAAEGYQLVIRLNGTSDIRWENYGIIQKHPDVQFYDYTKLPNRKNVPANYDLTYSYSGTAAFAPYVAQAVARGERIAVVFRSRKLVKALIKRNATFLGLPIIDGDNSDVRHRDPKGCIVALYAKGRAKKDRSGFVVDSVD